VLRGVPLEDDLFSIATPVTRRCDARHGRLARKAQIVYASVP